MRFQHSLDMRYLGQAYELNIPVGLIGHDVIAAFHRAHEMRYGYHHKNKKVEIVNVRCRATGITEKPPNQKIASCVRRANRLLPGQIVEITFQRTRAKNRFVPAGQPPCR